MISLEPDLCACILHGPHTPLLFHGPDLCRGILHDLYRGSLHGLCGLSLGPCLFLGRPSLELLEQGFSDWLGFSEWPAGHGLALIGRFDRRSNFAARRRIRCRRRQILRSGNGLNG